MNASFAARLLAWHARHGRHDLPWQREPDAYRVWVSEVMLQQTQVATVIPYFHRFIDRFPDVQSLAAARDDDMMQLWSGLGYYARARNLLKAARMVRDEYEGVFPADFEAVAALPGVGRSTVGAILALVFNQRHPILDGNCRRVYARHAAIDGWPGERAVAEVLWAHADACTPDSKVAAYTQAIMDLGALVCTRTKPACDSCPVAGDCIAKDEGLTDRLPTPRPRKARPHRETTVLVMQSEQGEILLERRPPNGIWGGLWSVPEIAGSAAPADAVPLASLRHAFTHFTLDIHALLVASSARDDAGTDRLWVAAEKLGQYGLPSPIRKILAKIAA